MSHAYMYKHNVDTARKYAYPPFAFRLYCTFERFTDLHFLNEYTHMRKICICLDTRLDFCMFRMMPNMYIHACMYTHRIDKMSHNCRFIFIYYLH